MNAIAFPVSLFGNLANWQVVSCYFDISLSWGLKFVYIGCVFISVACNKSLLGKHSVLFCEQH